jgi:hypothetical protein
MQPCIRCRITVPTRKYGPFTAPYEVNLWWIYGLSYRLTWEYLAGYNGALREEKELIPHQYLKDFKNLTIDKLNHSHHVNYKSISNIYLWNNFTKDDEAKKNGHFILNKIFFCIRLYILPYYIFLFFIYWSLINTCVGYIIYTKSKYFQSRVSYQWLYQRNNSCITYSIIEKRQCIKEYTLIVNFFLMESQLFGSRSGQK